MPAGCNIQRTAVAHPTIPEQSAFQYTVAEEHANRPVNWVSFLSAARFANWMHNGQGDGDTETGSYTMGPVNSNIVRNPGATFVVASNDEWHKAAFYNPATQSYYQYATSSDVAPTNVLPDTGNNANIWDGSTWRALQVAGTYENSASPYGTFDQCGNVQEWTDTIVWELGRLLRDGVASDSPTTRESNIPQMYPDYVGPWTEQMQHPWRGMGFRLAYVPEPGTALLCLVGAICLLWRRR